jgi:arginine N-succinyltransferase
LTGFQAFCASLADDGHSLPAAIAQPLGITPGTRIRHVAC